MDDDDAKTAERLAEVTVLDLGGKVVRLGELWRDRPLVLVFVRHFGCLFCREQVAQLAAIYPEIQARGAALAVVGNGSVRDAAAFAEERGVAFPLYTDPKRLAYQKAGLRHGVASTFSLKALGHSLRAFREGHRQGKTRGDAFQQGGAFVIAPGDRVLLVQRSAEGGDHVDPQALLGALPASD